MLWQEEEEEDNIYLINVFTKSLAVEEIYYLEEEGYLI